MTRRRVLLIGAMMATMLTIFTCGSKNITEITTAVKTTTAMETTMEGSIIEEPTATAEGMESEKTKDSTSEQIKPLAGEIQATMAAQDIGQLADLSSYLVYVSLEEGEGSEIESVDDFMATSEDKLFMEKLMTRTTDAKPGEPEVSSVSVIVGEDVNITSSNVDGEPKITGINL